MFSRYLLRNISCTSGMSFLEINIMEVTPSKGYDKTGGVGLPKVYTRKTSDSNDQEDDNQSTPFLSLSKRFPTLATPSM
jgi:hypothetical protein